ncbi:Sulfotransferase domain protein [Planctomycetes bacterium Pan216]|uniref:Sulfotransferase domain protein n=1 Tax=Kolteria novifilia TaxID=2527975 RepID=A0A518B8L2_9BACT|nr:Sulfotransferase domain protein [Planctomycetes bacterium Pan216]
MHDSTHTRSDSNVSTYPRADATLPNTFLIGAPKSGTTSLYEYLRTHPNVFFSTPKEPQFWAADFPRAIESSYYRIDSISDYLALFNSATDAHTVRAEATVTYLYSNVAVARILEFNPNAKFIVMLRHPIDLVHAWHSELLYNGYEDRQSLEEAWHLQEQRAQGACVPAACPVPAFLQYARMGCIGEQLERLYATVSQDRVHVIWFDDFANDTRAEYIKTLAFLNIPDDGRTNFQPCNASREMRFSFVSRLLFSPPKTLLPATRAARRAFQHLPPFTRRLIDGALRPQRQREKLSSAFINTLENAFAQDTKILSAVTGRQFRGPSITHVGRNK